MPPQLTYLAMELAWALPVVLLQWLLGHETLRAHWRPVLAGVAIPTAYLSVADSIAIGRGIWTLSPELTTRLVAFGVPLEEAAFFLLTNLMVVQGLLLLREPDEPLGRARRWCARLRKTFATDVVP
jgi:lycopene cyclase domain-containing protein